MAVELSASKHQLKSLGAVVEPGRTSSPAEPPKGPIAYWTCSSSPSIASSSSVLACVTARALGLGLERKGERKEERIPPSRDCGRLSQCSYSTRGVVSTHGSSFGGSGG